MLAFPNIKINLGLSITEKRPDGYHNLETVFYPVALEDALEIRTSSETEKKIILHQYGMEIAGNPEDNLVAKAYSLLDKEFHLPPVEIHLYKHIPSGASCSINLSIFSLKSNTTAIEMINAIANTYVPKNFLMIYQSSRFINRLLFISYNLVDTLLTIIGFQVEKSPAIMCFLASPASHR